MKVRGGFLVVFVLVLAGLAAYLTLPGIRARRDASEQAAALAVLARVPDPAGATVRPARECGGSTRCLHVDRTPDQVVPELTAALRAAAGAEPEVECADHTRASGPTLRSCTLRAPTGGSHGVIVWVQTSTKQVRPGELRPDGTHVELAAL